MKKNILLLGIFSIFALVSFCQQGENIPSLISACKNNDIAKVRNLLLLKSISVDTIWNGYTSLMYAVKNENFEIVKLLVDKGADVNLSVNSISPMWLADANNFAKKQSSNSKSIINYLINSALRNIPTAPTMNKIRKAIDTTLRESMNYPFTAIRFYKIYPDNTFNGSIRVLCDAAVYDKVAMYEAVRITGSPMDEPLPNLATHVMIEGANSNVFRLILDPNSKWQAKMFQINQISDATLQKIKTIIEEKSDPNTLLSNGIYPLLAASILGNKELVMNLIDLGANVNATSSGFSALHMACLDGYLSIVKLLIEKGADVNLNCPDGANCLTLSVQSGHADVVDFLIKQGLSPNFQKKGGITPLILAIVDGQIKVVKVLLNNGADPNFLMPEGKQTALLWASLLGWDKIVELLISKKANVNIPDKYGLTPLHYACEYGYIRIVQILLQAGANQKIKSLEGMTPADFAKENNHLKVLEMLKTSGNYK